MKQIILHGYTITVTAMGAGNAWRPRVTIVRAGGQVKIDHKDSFPSEGEATDYGLLLGQHWVTNQLQAATFARYLSSGSPTAVKLRNHPLMSYRGVRNWPPVWNPVQGKENTRLTGEIGTLKHVSRDNHFTRKLDLIIEYGMSRYMGSLIFDDAAFCHQIHTLLQSFANRSIEEIGDLDLVNTLYGHPAAIASAARPQRKQASP